jgi:hypothetical protein
MRGFAHICFFGSLVALCSWYGWSQTRELLIRSGEKVYTTTGMDSATNFTRDHLTQPFRRSVREAETSTPERVRRGIQSAESVASGNALGKSTSMLDAVVSWTKQAVRMLFTGFTKKPDADRSATFGTSGQGTAALITC